MEKPPEFTPESETNFEDSKINITAAETLVEEMTTKKENGEEISDTDVNDINEMIKTLQEAQLVVDGENIRHALVQLMELRN